LFKLAGLIMTKDTSSQPDSQPVKKRRLLHLDKETKHKLITLFIAVFGFTILMLLIGELLGGTERLRALVEEGGAWAPLVYIFFKIVTFVVAPLSGASIEMAAGALFGVWLGTILSVIGSTIGAMINYWIARTLGRVGVLKFAGRKALSQVDATADRVGGWRVLLVARVLLAPIYDFVSYAAGLARFPFGQFVTVTLLAGIPVNVLFPLLGHASATSKFATYGILIITAVLFIGFLVVHVRHKRKLRRQERALSAD
jgi:uncharacterized membrane protein YdjX (TVP38/TMEM64 family)